MLSPTKVKKILEDPTAYANKVKVEELAKTLRELSKAYYNTGKSIVDDETFDLMKDILKTRDPQNAFLLETGAPIVKGKVKLPYPMGSLDKIKPNTPELTKWLANYKGPFVLSDKLDGTSAQFYKDEKGNYKLYSRGNGTYGQDISHLIKYVVSKNAKLDMIPNNTSIRGELIMTKQDFKKIADTMENARNAVSGAVNSKKINMSIVRYVKFVTYNVIHPRLNHIDQMKLLETWKFDIVDYKIVGLNANSVLTEELLTTYLEDRRKNSVYDVDGIVVVDAGKIYKHEEGNPDHAFAFKKVMSDQIAETTIVNVLWEPSKDGYLKPTIEIKPVKLVGTTITYCTAHNAKYVVDNKLGPGAIIKIVRSGDVIPKIMSVVKPAKEAKMPDIPYKWNETNVDIVLKNITGEQQTTVITKQMTYFFKGIGAKYMDEGIITKFVNAGYKSVTKLLSADKEKLTQIEGIGEKIVDKIFESINEALENIELSTFMAASNLFGRGLGEKKIKLITDEIPNIMTDNLDNKTLKEKINNIKGFDDLTTDRFVGNLGKFKKFYEDINKIIDISHLTKIKNKKKMGNLFTNQSVVFTGFRNKDMEKFITDNGGKVSGSVSSKTNLVVYSGDKSGSKAQKAVQLNLAMMTEEEFISKYMTNK